MMDNDKDDAPSPNRRVAAIYGKSTDPRFRGKVGVYAPTCCTHVREGGALRGQAEASKSTSSEHTTRSKPVGATKGSSRMGSQGWVRGGEE